MARFITLLAVFGFVSSAAAQLIPSGIPGNGPPDQPNVGPDSVNYQVDDGTAEDAIGIGGTATFDLLWLNRFTVQPGGEVITNISATYGSPGQTTPYNGRPVTILLYNDPDGGSVTNATLVHQQNAVITNANTNTFNNYAVPNVAVSNQFLVGVLAPNLPGSQGFVASYDTTPPHSSNVSFAGFTSPGNTMNFANLASIPATQFGAIESFLPTLPGNWLIRATGIPEPSCLALLGLAGLLAVRRR